MSVAAPVVVGQVVAEKYRVERILGSGGMGVVVVATHLELGKSVAIKFMLEESVSNQDSVERFLREARATASIRSEHVARVLDMGRQQNGAPYMVMEYLEGSDLASIVAAKGPVSVAVAAEYLLHACDAVAEAHSLGIIHRDIKPANLFLTKTLDGTPLLKVLDFGISKMTLPTRVNPLTKTASVMGSPAYMSPEQLRSPRTVDPRADIWSLGVVLHELVSGTPPFAAETIGAVCVKVMLDPCPEVTSTEKVPPGFGEVVARCLEKEPARRFQTVAELARALARYAPPHVRPLAERATRLLADISGSGEVVVAPQVVHRPRRLAAIGAGAAAAVIAVAVTAWVASGHRRAKAQESSPATPAMATESTAGGREAPVGTAPPADKAPAAAAPPAAGATQHAVVEPPPSTVETVPAAPNAGPGDPGAPASSVPAPAVPPGPAGPARTPATSAARPSGSGPVPTTRPERRRPAAASPTSKPPRSAPPPGDDDPLRSRY
jgi:eukaryotic-like serine/threonine-protein kinase